MANTNVQAAFLKSFRGQTCCSKRKHVRIYSRGNEVRFSERTQKLEQKIIAGNDGRISCGREKKGCSVQQGAPADGLHDELRSA